MSDKHTDAQGELPAERTTTSTDPRDQAHVAGWNACLAKIRATEGQAQTSAARSDAKVLVDVATGVIGQWNMLETYDKEMTERFCKQLEREFAAQLADSTAPGAPVEQTRFIDEIDAARAGEAWLAQVQTTDHTRAYIPDMGNQAPKIKWAALFDQHDKLTHAFLLTRDLMNWTQITFVGLAAPTAQQSLTAGGAVGAILELRANLYDLQENLEAFGEHSQNVAHAALDGAIEALDEVAERYSSVPCAKTAEDVEEEFARTLPGPFYMDLPDGGSPSILEQVRRMAQDAARFRWLNTYHADGETRWCAHMLAKRLFHGDYDDVARDIDAEMKKDIQK